MPFYSCSSLPSRLRHLRPNEQLFARLVPQVFCRKLLRSHCMLQIQFRHYKLDAVLVHGQCHRYTVDAILILQVTKPDEFVAVLLAVFGLPYLFVDAGDCRFYLLRRINIRTKFRKFQNRRVNPGHLTNLKHSLDIYLTEMVLVSVVHKARRVEPQGSPCQCSLCSRLPLR